MAYTFPYCTFDKLRISSANGIKFRYLTGDGSFFEGETIQDNTFYNEDSNCGFNWESFAQKIPCDGTIRLQFQWCDTSLPLIHIFSNDEFVIEVNPTKVYSGSYDIYEIELNFGSESDFCNSCIDLRIATQVITIGGISVYFDQQYGKTFVRNNTENFNLFEIEPTYQARGVSVFDGGAILIAYGESKTKIYKWVGFWDLIYTTLISEFNHVKAFDSNNFVVVSESTSGYAIYCKNGVITEESIGGTSYFVAINGENIDNIYALSQTPFGVAKIFSRTSDTWGIWFDYGTSLSFPTGVIASGSPKFFVIDGVIYNVFRRSGNAIFNSIPISGGYNETVIESGTFASLDILDSQTMVMATQNNLYQMIEGIITLDSDFSTIRTSVGDTSNIISVSYESTNRIFVITTTNSYVRDGDWEAGISGIQNDGNPFIITGLYNYKSSYNYHAQSEPIKIGSTECLIPLEYWNIEDYDGQYFCDGFRNILYIEAQFIKYSPIETSSVYITSNNAKRVLSKNIAKKRELDINYIPEYLHDIATIAFSMDNLLINGKSFTAESGYKILDNNSLYSLSKASIEVYENLYKFENSNCDNECGGNQPATPACTLPDSDGFWGGNAEI